MNQKPLTDKQYAFVNEYVKDYNATQAAIRAGYAEKYADRQAYQLLEKTRVKEAIEARRQEISRKADVEISEIVAELRSIAFTDGSRTDKLRALELLGRYKAMFTDRFQNTTESHAQLTDEEQEQLKEMAKELTKPKIKLHKASQND
ncbi:MAG: terminase small subunit [Planctomycetota bacterium]|jgi:phage terminase small subunit